MSNDNDVDDVESCLLCDRRVHQRGLCTMHYSRFVATLKDFPSDAAREAFDKQMVAEKCILPPKRGKRGIDNEFDEKARKFLEAWKESGANVNNILPNTPGVPPGKQKPKRIGTKKK